MLKKYLSSRTPYNYSLYLSTFNECLSLSATLYTNYLTNTESAIITDTRRFFNFINIKRKCDSFPSSMALDNLTSTDPAKISNLFADFFSRSFIDTSSPIDHVYFNSLPPYNQTPLNAPSVFNFFYPDYKFPGALANAGLDSPEFQLSSDAEIMRLSNSVTNMLIGVNNTNAHGLASFVNGDDAVLFNFGEFMTAAQTANAGIPALIDKIANRLVGGPLTAGVKTEIQNFVTNTTYFPLTAPTPTNAQMRDRVRAIVHAIAISGDYAVQR